MLHDLSGHAIAIPGLTAVPVDASARWVAKTVTTDPPKYLPHEEWTLEWTICAGVPVLVIPCLDDGDCRHWARGSRSTAKASVTLSLKFMPHDWRNSNAVRVVLSSPEAAPQTDRDDVALKADPRPLVRRGGDEAGRFSTGQLISLAEIAARPPLVARALMVCASDTESARNGRWRFKGRLGLTATSDLPFLAGGLQCGDAVLI